jgi:hypothetical protein
MKPTKYRLKTTIFISGIAFMFAFLPILATGKNATKDELMRRIEDLEELVQTQSNALEDLQDMLRCIDTSSNSATLVFSGCNVHIRNGVGSTNSANAQGNLIIGYNENPWLENRQGSHNVIVGPNHGYAGVSGLAVGTTSASLSVSANKVTVDADLDVIIKSGLSILQFGSTETNLDSKDITLKASRTATIKGASSVEINSTSF